MTSHPTISVVMATYNHEKYIVEAIDSILNQTYTNFEFIIIDDGSTDNTVDIIKGYKDPRIKLINQKRQGPSVAFNNGIKNSTGEYIAFMSGDDVSTRNRLETQIAQLNLHQTDIIFTIPIIIGPRSETLNSEVCPWFFGKEFNNNAQLYRYLFEYGNFLCAPSAFSSKTVIDEIGFFRTGLIQLQDFDFWIRAIKKKKTIKVFKDPVIKYRFLFGENLSSVSNNNRLRVELSFVYREFFEQVPLDIFVAAFGQDAPMELNNSEIDCQIYQSILLIDHREALVRLIGAERIIEQLDDDVFYKHYSEIANFNLVNFFNTENLIDLKEIYPSRKLSRIRHFFAQIANSNISFTLSEQNAKKIIQEYLEKGNYDKAIALVRGMDIIHPNRTIVATIGKVIQKIWRKIKEFISHINSFADRRIRSTRNLAIYSIERLYDYSNRHQSIIFEDDPEALFLIRPNVIGVETVDLNEGKAFCPKPYISKLKDVVVTGGSDYVITNEGVVLNDELVDFSGDEFGIKSPYVKFRYKDKLILGYLSSTPRKLNEGILISCGHDFNYFHWMVECLPKLLFIEQIPQLRDMPLLIANHLHKNLETALEKCNIYNHDIVRLNTGVPYQVKKLFFPSALSRIVDRYEGEVVFNSDIVLSKYWITKVSNRLKESTGLSKVRPWRKLFLTRRKGIRSVENIKELEQILLTFGFQIVELDDVSLDFQIELFSQASFIVAPTGAGLTNLIFCQPNTKVIIFMSNHEISNYYLWTQLGNIMGLDVTILTGERLYNLTNYYSVHDDYRIDPDILISEISKQDKLIKENL